MALDPLLLPHLAFVVILAGGLYLFITEKLRVDVTAMLIVLALVLTGVLDSKQALSGFASEPAIIVAAVFRDLRRAGRHRHQRAAGRLYRARGRHSTSGGRSRW
jgi:hypothetical protein